MHDFSVTTLDPESSRVVDSGGSRVLLHKSNDLYMYIVLRLYDDDNWDRALQSCLNLESLSRDTTVHKRSPNKHSGNRVVLQIEGTLHKSYSTTPTTFSPESTTPEDETWGARVERQKNKKTFVPLSKKDQNKKSNEGWT